MNLRNVNLNLLPILLELLRHQSVSAAARSLGLTQPAVSTALVRLREILGDPLLVQVGRGMQLTPRGEELLPLTQSTCETVGDLLTRPAFDPATARRSFVIASADHGPLVLAPPLLPRLSREAPGLSVQFIDFEPDLLERAQHRRIDFMMAPSHVFAELANDLIVTMPITRFEDFVAVIAPHHRLGERPALTRDDLRDEPHVVFHPGIQRKHELAGSISGVAAEERVIGRFQQFSILPLIAALTDTVAIVPRSVAQQLQRLFAFRMIEGTDAQSHTDLFLGWNRYWDSDPAHVWMRGLIRDIMAQA